MAFLTMNFAFPNCKNLGDCVLVFDAHQAHALALQRRFWRLASVARRHDGVREAVTGDGNLTILHDRVFDREGFIESMRACWMNCDEATPARQAIDIPVRYDGEDLASVARACGLDPERVVELHTSGEYVVAFVGFQPGFAYLEGLDARLHVPRRAEPRVRVPAGAVALANGYTAVYPLAAPGGWHLIGSSDTALFDPQRDPFALLEPGDRVRFVAV